MAGWWIQRLHYWRCEERSARRWDARDPDDGARGWERAIRRRLDGTDSQHGGYLRGLLLEASCGSAETVVPDPLGRVWRCGRSAGAEPRRTCTAPDGGID